MQEDCGCTKKEPKRAFRSKSIKSDIFEITPRLGCESCNLNYTLLYDFTKSPFVIPAVNSAYSFISVCDASRFPDLSYILATNPDNGDYVYLYIESKDENKNLLRVVNKCENNGTAKIGTVFPKYSKLILSSFIPCGESGLEDLIKNILLNSGKEILEVISNSEDLCLPLLPNIEQGEKTGLLSYTIKDNCPDLSSACLKKVDNITCTGNTLCFEDLESVDSIPEANDYSVAIFLGGKCLGFLPNSIIAFRENTLYAPLMPSVDSLPATIGSSVIEKSLVCWDPVSKKLKKITGLNISKILSPTPSYDAITTKSLTIDAAGNACALKVINFTESVGAGHKIASYSPDGCVNPTTIRLDSLISEKIKDTPLSFGFVNASSNFDLNSDASFSAKVKGARVSIDWKHKIKAEGGKDTEDGYLLTINGVKTVKNIIRMPENVTTSGDCFMINTGISETTVKLGNSINCALSTFQDSGTADNALSSSFTYEVSVLSYIESFV